jgi:HD-like signal output (HDOD) protein
LPESPMETQSSSDRLRALFRKTGALPAMPTAVSRLIEAIDSPSSSAQTIEQIVSTDPALASRILCVANSALSGYSTPVGTIRGAIMRLGMESVRSIALSFMVTSVASKNSTTRYLNVARYAQHSVFVGVMSRYLFGRLQKRAPFKSVWSPEEIMAAGVLHDVAVPLLASLATEDFESICAIATREAVTFDVAFNRHHDVSLGELSAEACDGWKLPKVFAQSLRHFEKPWLAAEEVEAVSCIHYANYVADTHGHSLTVWGTQEPMPEEFNPEIVVDLDEMEYVLDAVERHVGELLKTSAQKAA